MKKIALFIIAGHTRNIDCSVYDFGIITQMKMAEILANLSNDGLKFFLDKVPASHVKTRQAAKEKVVALHAVPEFPSSEPRVYFYMTDTNEIFFTDDLKSSELVKLGNGE
jgi:hypothetical protein